MLTVGVAAILVRNYSFLPASKLKLINLTRVVFDSKHNVLLLFVKIILCCILQQRKFEIFCRFHWAERCGIWFCRISSSVLELEWSIRWNTLFLFLHKVTNGRLIISRTFLPVTRPCEQSFYCILSNCKMLGDFLSIQLQQFLRFIQLLILDFAYISLFNSQYLIQ